MGKRSKGGKKPTSDRYTLPQVAMLLMQAPELYQSVTSPSSQSYESIYGKPARNQQEEKIGETHAEILRGLRLSDAEKETMLIGLIDLDVAMRSMPEGTLRGVASFVQFGPKEINAKEVIFRHGHTHHVMTVWRQMNGEFNDQERANANLRRRAA